MGFKSSKQGRDGLALQELWTLEEERKLVQVMSYGRKQVWATDERKFVMNYAWFVVRKATFTN